MSKKNNGNGASFKVLSPIGKKTVDVMHATSHFSDLNEKTICELDGRVFRANETLPIIRALLQQRYPAAKFIKAGEIYSPSSHDQAVKTREKSLADLRAALLRGGCDAVITGNGA